MLLFINLRRNLCLVAKSLLTNRWNKNIYIQKQLRIYTTIRFSRPGAWKTARSAALPTTISKTITLIFFIDSNHSVCPPRCDSTNMHFEFYSFSWFSSIDLYLFSELHRKRILLWLDEQRWHLQVLYLVYRWQTLFQCLVVLIRPVVTLPVQVVQTRILRVYL